MSFARLLRIWRHRMDSIWKHDALDREAARELAFHFDQLVAEHLASGMPAAEARRAARLALGNVTVLEEQIRDERRVTWVHDAHQDLRYGLRMLRQTPALTSVAVASLALGIGANGALLGVMDALRHQLLPFPDDRRLVVVKTVPLDAPARVANASLPDYIAWKERADAFETLGASLVDERDFGDEANGFPERIYGQLFTPSLFETLGVQPAIGRLFTDDEARPDRPAAVLILSHRLWQHRFAGDPKILGRQIRANGVLCTVIGVMPPAFRYPDERTQYWAPLPINPIQARGSARYFVVTGRLKAGVSIAQAEASLSAVAAQLAVDFPERHKGWGLRVRPVREALFGWTATPFLTMEAAVALLLTTACVNVAGLLLARGTTRRSEMAMRFALGARRERIVRQLVTESLLLAFIGGALGMVVARWGVRALTSTFPAPGALAITHVSMNARMVALMIGLSAVVGIAVGLTPALVGSRRNLLSLRSGGEAGGGTDQSRPPVWGAFAAAQIALALVLLVGAGLVANSFVRLAQRDLTFDADLLLTFDYRIPGVEYTNLIGSYNGFPYFEITQSPSTGLQRVYDRLRRVPTIEAVAGISYPHLNSIIVPEMTVTLEGRAPSSSGDLSALTASYFLVTPNLFGTLRVPLVAGRDFNDRDTSSAPWVAVVNETAARRFWPGEDPIGKRFSLDIVPDERPREVVGVVRDVPIRRTQTGGEPVIYASYLQQPSRYRGPWLNMFGQMTFLARTSGSPGNVAPDVRRAVAEVDPNRALANVGPLADQLDAQLHPRRSYTVALAIFAAAATLLAGMGTYGVMAYAVAQRYHELGVRIALGAGARQIASLIGLGALRLIAIGLTAGLAMALAATGLIKLQLYQITPTDPATFIAVSLLLAMVGIVACLVPLGRALRVDPTTALKYE
jgi:putative ABC transport system permease protein